MRVRRSLVLALAGRSPDVRSCHVCGKECYRSFFCSVECARIFRLAQEAKRGRAPP